MKNQTGFLQFQNVVSIALRNVPLVCNLFPVVFSQRCRHLSSISICEPRHPAYLALSIDIDLCIPMFIDIPKNVVLVSFVTMHRNRIVYELR